MTTFIPQPTPAAPRGREAWDAPIPADNTSTTIDIPLLELPPTLSTREPAPIPGQPGYDALEEQTSQHAEFLRNFAGDRTIVPFDPTLDDIFTPIYTAQYAGTFGEFMRTFGPVVALFVVGVIAMAIIIGLEITKRRTLTNTALILVTAFVLHSPVASLLDTSPPERDTLENSIRNEALATHADATHAEIAEFREHLPINIDAVCQGQHLTETQATGLYYDTDTRPFRLPIPEIPDTMLCGGDASGVIFIMDLHTGVMVFAGAYTAFDGVHTIYEEVTGAGDSWSKVLHNPFIFAPASVQAINTGSMWY